MKNLLITCALCVMVSACGWHLRGSLSTQLDIESAYVQAQDTYGALATDLKRALTSNKVMLATTSSAAEYVIYLDHEQRDRRTVAVGNAALASEYELTLSARYKITAQDGRVIVDDTASAIRSYSVNANAIAANDEEEAIIAKELRNNLVQQILRRLQFATKASPSSSQANGQTAP